MCVVGEQSGVGGMSKARLSDSSLLPGGGAGVLGEEVRQGPAGDWGLGSHTASHLEWPLQTHG